MKKIETFEQAIKNKVPNLKQCGINPTLFWAYRRSIEAGNEKIDFSECIWENEIEEITKCLKDINIVEFTISSTYSSLIEVLAEFQNHGFQMAGLTEVNANYTDWQTGKNKVVPAVRMLSI